MLIQRDLIRVDEDHLNKYLDLYANDSSVLMSDLQYEAIDTLFEIGHKFGFYDDILKSKNYTIPDEYQDIRNS
jgi:1,4-dihydroxy-6-naphthoate synthase